LPVAQRAAEFRDPDDLRLDLGIDRSRAVLLQAEILTRLGRLEEARERATAFLRRWASEDPRQRDRKTAERLSAAGASRESLPPSPNS
jgi:hypothetical protein